MQLTSAESAPRSGQLAGAMATGEATATLPLLEVKGPCVLPAADALRAAAAGRRPLTPSVAWAIAAVVRDLGARCDPVPPLAVACALADIR